MLARKAAAGAALLLMLATKFTAARACSAAPGAPLEELCSGNGVCAAGTGTCTCDAGWAGESCSMLDFLPAAATTSCGPACAYHGDGDKNTSWGGTPLWLAAPFTEPAT